MFENFSKQPFNCEWLNVYWKFFTCCAVDWQTRQGYFWDFGGSFLDTLINCSTFCTAIRAGTQLGDCLLNYMSKVDQSDSCCSTWARIFKELLNLGPDTQKVAQPSWARILKTIDKFAFLCLHCVFALNTTGVCMWKNSVLIYLYKPHLKLSFMLFN